jgi:hypothetical protein
MSPDVTFWGEGVPVPVLGFDVPPAGKVPAFPKLKLIVPSFLIMIIEPI